MDKLKKIIYTAGFYIFSVNSFAISCNEVTNLISLSKWIAVIVGLPLIITGIAMQAPQLLVIGLMFSIALFYSPSMFNMASGESSIIDDCPKEPETHYWQSILSFLGSACYFVFPLIGTLVAMVIIAVVIESSYTKSFNANQEALIKRKSGELLFFLNQLYRQLAEDKSDYRQQTLDLICTIHEASHISLTELKTYVKSYREIKTNILA
ncbi:MAG TPA: hypothetical protein PLP75_01600 [Burkholderiales bacterium]|nr:hypothetical protein [Burkholderiales bacterium]